MAEPRSTFAALLGIAIATGWGTRFDVPRGSRARPNPARLRAEAAERRCRKSKRKAQRAAQVDALHRLLSEDPDAARITIEETKESGEVGGNG